MPDFIVVLSSDAAYYSSIGGGPLPSLCATPFDRRRVSFLLLREGRLINVVVLSEVEEPLLKFRHPVFGTPQSRYSFADADAVSAFYC